MATKNEPIHLSENQMMRLIGAGSRIGYLYQEQASIMGSIQSADGKAVRQSLDTYLGRLAHGLRSAAVMIEYVHREIAADPLDSSDVISSIEDMLGGQDDERKGD